MKWLVQHSRGVLLLLIFGVAGAAVLLWPYQQNTSPRPKAVDKNDREIVWLSTASNSPTWFRFVDAVRTAQKRMEDADPSSAVTVDTTEAFPSESTAVPEVSIAFAGEPGKLRIRWYKLTSEWNSTYWVKELLQRSPPPLAIIGGANSDSAIQLAQAIQNQSEETDQPAPLFLVTQGTKTRLTKQLVVQVEDKVEVPYSDRTLRFCFSNKRLAESVCDFIWNQPSLRPDCRRYYVSYWEDDAYSKDLLYRFNEAVNDPAEGRALERFTPQPIFTSVGTFDRPNQEETDTARKFLEDVTLLDSLEILTRRQICVYQPLNAIGWLSVQVGREGADTSRPLLVLTGQLQPSRRLLRAMVRSAPGDIQRFVVTTGDAIAFNTIFRDRDVHWPIQDFPCDLVLFCHRNPVDPSAGFRNQSGGPREEITGRARSTGTEDVLLYSDIVESLVYAAHKSEGKLVADADELLRRMRNLRWNLSAGRIATEDGFPLLFDASGDREIDTGEHVVWLRPRKVGRVVLPEAQLRVYTKDPGQEGGWRLHWETIVPYEGAPSAEVRM